MNNQLIRTFLAVNFSDNTINEINDYIQNLKKFNCRIKWVEKHNLHLTLKFWGEIGLHKVESIKNELSKQIVQPMIHYTIEGTGVFPKQRDPRVIWIGIHDINSEIHNHFKLVEEISGNLNLPLEKRKFKPHLTIGRVKATNNIQNLLDYMNERPFRPIKEKANSITLYQSILHKHGPEYKNLLKIDK